MVTAPCERCGRRHLPHRVSRAEAWATVMTCASTLALLAWLAVAR